MNKPILLLVILIIGAALTWVYWPKAEDPSAFTISEEWVERPLDHQNLQDGTFLQQVLTLRPNGAGSDADLFFIIGNETDATAEELTAYWKTYGSPTNMVFAVAEHRGYGQSVLNGDNTIPTYVSIDQALADDVLALEELKQKWGGRTISAGCSYGGSLAIQFAHDYPGAMDATIASSPPIFWPNVIPEYSEQVRENLGDELTDRLGAHFANLNPQSLYDEIWRRQQLLAALVSAISQREDSQSFVPIVAQLSALPTDAFMTNIENIMPPEGFHYSDNRIAQTVTAEMAKTGAYNWHTWKYQQCSGLGVFFGGHPFGFTIEDAQADCLGTFGTSGLLGAQPSWDVSALIPSISKPIAIVVGGKDPWTRLSVAPDHDFANIQYIHRDDGFHCPDLTHADTANEALASVLSQIDR